MEMTTEEKAKDKRLYSVYGITLAEWNEIFDKQGGVCAVCKELPKSKVLCVDHEHIKGFKTMLPEEKRKYVRGLCCFLCNVSFKGFEKTASGEKNRQRLEGTYEYFKKYRLKGEK